MSDVPDTYINSVRIDASIYEFVFTCSIITPEREGERSSRDLVRIRMSPQHARALSVLLDKHLRKFGEKFGDISLPEELISMLMSDDPLRPDDDDEESIKESVG